MRGVVALTGYLRLLQLWDYGVEGDSFVLVLRRYECSLAQWRAALPADPAPYLRLYLSVFGDVLRAVQVQLSLLCQTVKHWYKHMPLLLVHLTCVCFAHADHARGQCRAL